MAYDFSISSSVLSNGRTSYNAQLLNSTEPKFTFAYRTAYLDNFGLFNTGVNNGLVYKPEDYEKDYGFWAYFIYPTAMAESRGSFVCLNTYDRAKFTFTFMQYAAHVPNGDFVNFFKSLLGLPNAKEYFPKLILQNNQIFYRNSSGVLNLLETNSSSQALMDYLNPTLTEIDQQELICAARFVHWATNDIEHRKVQVETAVNMYKENMLEYHKRFGLDGVPASVCQMICDIRHQGRGMNDRIALALNTKGNYEKAFSNLCTIGNTNYQSRITTVRNTISKLKAIGKFNKIYDARRAEFV
ncbi:hypothetical protein EZL74_11125 [Flavobacterium silvisoli]|uniref:Uncharacterized protein n=1 Tax=Flavobacterium silvisoli TaxID=2529433 RepID=A0A4Q9YVS6_9FLAO|nr:hypothetical protein [Flavobacterium silvisoli]TBX66132.1 hypothetical protein EZL74_11125 [Flavobacterium silvisoli]